MCQTANSIGMKISHIHPSKGPAFLKTGYCHYWILPKSHAHLYTTTSLSLSSITIKPGKRTVKFNVNRPRSVWCHFDWQVDSLPSLHTSIDHVTRFRLWSWVQGGHRCVSKCSNRWLTCQNINKVTWPTSCQSNSDTKLSAAAFYRRFLGWVIKNIKKIKKRNSTGGRAKSRGSC